MIVDGDSVGDAHNDIEHQEFCDDNGSRRCMGSRKRREPMPFSEPAHLTACNRVGQLKTPAKACQGVPSTGITERRLQLGELNLPSFTRAESSVTSETMLPTVSPGWSSLQTVRSRLSGRLSRFSRSDNDACESSSQTLQNKIAFLETDLRHSFITISSITTIPEENVHRFERCAQDLLSALNDIVNVDLVEALTALKTTARSTDGLSDEGANSHDLVPLAEHYPALSRLLSLLETSPGQFSLVTDQGSSLFVLPEGQDGDAVMTSVAEIKDLLSRVPEDANKQPTSLTLPLPTDDDSCTTLDQAAGHQQTAPRRYASSIVNAVFEDIRQRNCGKLHEIKLKVSDEWQTSAREVPLEMFFSCCLDPMAWHEAKCRPIQYVLLCLVGYVRY